MLNETVFFVLKYGTLTKLYVQTAYGRLCIQKFGAELNFRTRTAGFVPCCVEGLWAIHDLCERICSYCGTRGTSGWS
jgi:hypothetical protein